MITAAPTSADSPLLSRSLLLIAIMDTVPHIPAAGYKPPTDRNSTAACVQPDLDPHSIAQLNATLASFTLHAASDTAPTTLAAIDPHYKYRRTFQTQPGLRFIHPGLTHQPAHSTNLAHGITSKHSLTAADVLASASASAASSPLVRFMEHQKEATYASNRMAPLGASLIRGHVLPLRHTDRRVPLRRQHQKERRRQAAHLCSHTHSTHRHSRREDEHGQHRLLQHTSSSQYEGSDAVRGATDHSSGRSALRLAHRRPDRQPGHVHVRLTTATY